MIGFHGATQYEMAIGPVWITIPYWRFLIVGCWPRMGVDFGDEVEQETAPGSPQSGKAAVSPQTMRAFPPHQ
jgi:hypothetical protein